MVRPPPIVTSKPPKMKIVVTALLNIAKFCIANGVQRERTLSINYLDIRLLFYLFLSLVRTVKLSALAPAEQLLCGCKRTLKIAPEHLEQKEY